MIRLLHRWPGLLAMVLLLALALSGAALSVFPAAERLSMPAPVAGQTVADLAARVAASHPGLEQIRRAPSGQISAWWFQDGNPGSAIVDPMTGKDLGSADPNGVERWLVEFHRSLFLGDGGRIAMAVAAAAMLVLAASGAVMVARRMGGWRRWFARAKGAGSTHVRLARWGIAGLGFSALTAIWMTGSTFDLLPDQAVPPPEVQASGETGAALATSAPLIATPVGALRDLSFPAPDDPTDVYKLTTDMGVTLIDQGTGQQIGFSAASGWQRASDLILSLHTGRGAAVVGLALGLMALTVPGLALTGTLVWWGGRRGRPRIKGLSRAGHAETVILVGSEGGATWGFAETLAEALVAAGQGVHLAAMAAFDPSRYSHAKRILILAATYGDGEAPASAKGFLDRLAALPSGPHMPRVPVAVLGFGDRAFSHFCGYAAAVTDGLRAKDWAELLAPATVNRQSPQDFARWGRDLGAALGLPLALVHHAAAPRTLPLTLLSRRDHGAEVQAPTAILRFQLPRRTLWQRLTVAGFGRFQAGDLVGIVPEGSDLPRFYSLASGTRDGFLEIVVRKQAGGLASGQLLALEPGATVAAFLRHNPGFHAGRGRVPLLLIGAGTGVGPLAGMVRSNSWKRPVTVYFGHRHRDSDFLYAEDWRRWLLEGRLARLVTTTSRGARPHHVQDALRRDGEQVARLIRSGARVMVCGGRDMAQGVAEVLGQVLAPSGLTLAALRAEGRYVEDCY